MNPSAATLVRQSWKQVLPIRDEAAELFYTRLFELDPALQPLFTGDMAEQGRKLIAMISVAVSNLERPATLLPALGALGARHSSYGVKDHHYDTVAAALLDTLQRGLGEAFTPDVKAAWVESYRVITRVMRTAAADHVGALA